MFVVTADVAVNEAGPATIISYFIAGVSAMLSSFCYAEYAVDYPVAGGAFFYILMTFGEYIGWCVLPGDRPKLVPSRLAQSDTSETGQGPILVPRDWRP